jgi:hypothetical protein
LSIGKDREHPQSSHFFSITEIIFVFSSYNHQRQENALYWWVVVCFLKEKEKKTCHSFAS